MPDTSRESLFYPLAEPELVTPKMTAAQVKNRLYSRHPASSAQMPGAWTCIEEWRNIDFLAFSAWASASGGRYARIGYEVKVSRSDLRSELLRPSKRAENVAWCNEFYLAVPKGLLTADEMAYEEPEWAPEDFQGAPCPGFAGQRCEPRWRRQRWLKTHFVRLPKPSTSRYDAHDYVQCPTCQGKGTVTTSRVEQEAPTLWVPRDLGLVVVDGRGSKVVRKAPRRKEVPALSAGELGQFARWISMRPDPRHVPRPIRQAVA